MKAVAITVHNNSSKDAAPQTVVSEAGKPTIIQATDNTHYELLDIEYDVAPDHIITRRDGDNLVVTFGQNNDGLVIIEGFYNFDNSCLVGISETSEYYYYIPDTGEISDYLALLQVGDNLSGHALGGLTVEDPWWANTSDTKASSQPENAGVTPTTESEVTSNAAEPMTAVDTDSIYTPTSSGAIPTNYAPWIFLGFVGVAGLTYAANNNDDDKNDDDITTVSDDDSNSQTSENSLTYEIDVVDTTVMTLESNTADYSLSTTDTIVLGNALDNSIVGNDLDNTLNGAQGNDTLTGGTGADTFVFSDVLDSIDTITDFTIGEDKIQLDSNVFSSLNTSMDNIMDYIQYDTNTGHLSYDSDAQGSTASVHFITLDTGLELGSDSFIVI